MRTIALLAALFLGLAWAKCDHPFYPVQEGWVWTYRSSPSGETHTISTSGVTNTGFTQRYAFKSFSFESQWRCDAKGLAQPEYVQPGSVQGLQMNFKTKKASGVVIPPTLSVGTTWTYSYEVSGEAKRQTLTIRMNQSVSVTNKIVGQESVSVPAGKFSAFKVESTLTQQGTMSIGGREQPLNLNVKTTSWYAQGVGLVKSVSENNTTELVSLKR